MRGSQYSKEFKNSTVQLALNSDKSVIEIGKDLDIKHKTIYSWIQVYKQAHNIKTDGRRKNQISTVKENINDENKRLRAENKVLKQERDISKKAAAYFAGALEILCQSSRITTTHEYRSRHAGYPQTNTRW
ncbi:MAG: hypothetical protein COA44_15540 [Arcobacter sp.]|nr:MAG: hypothetical protein COA44_15540 [Arcobacter sp.]